MCHSSSLTILARCEEGYVGYCAGCGHFSVAYKTVLLLVREADLFAFKQWIDEFVGGWYMEVPTLHGKEIGVKTPMPSLFLLFTQTEYQELQRMLSLAAFMIDVRKNMEENKN